MAIARSLAVNPDAMPFDAVTAALDPKTVREGLVTIGELAAEGMTRIPVTHEMGFAREIAGHVYFTDRNITRRARPARYIFDQASDPRTREFLSQILQRSCRVTDRKPRACHAYASIRGDGCSRGRLLQGIRSMPERVSRLRTWVWR